MTADSNPASLDLSLAAEAAPPGSLRYYALLFAESGRRDVLQALHLLEDELNATARGTHHDVAHTRLKWWSDEIDRWQRGQAAHPATKALEPARPLFLPAMTKLRGIVDAAAMDLACVTYADAAELATYFDKSGGVLGELAARWLLRSQSPADASLETARRLGATIRAVETFRDVRAHAIAGRIYFPLDLLDRAGITVADLRASSWSGKTLAFLEQRRQALESSLQESLGSVPAVDRSALRPLLILASLHLRLTQQLRTDLPRHPPLRSELKPFAKLWWAWRAARQAR